MRSGFHARKRWERLRLVDIGHSPAIDFQELLSSESPGPMVNPQENTKKCLNFFGTTYRCCASSAGTPALNILPACSAMSSKTAHTAAIPRCPQSCPCPGTNNVSLSHEAKVFSVARHPETVVFSSRHAGYHP